MDTRTWAIRTVDPEAQTFDVAGGLLLARRWYAEHGRTPMGVAAYDLTGSPRWRRFSGSNATVWAPGGRHVYVDVGDHGKRRTHVVEALHRTHGPYAAAQAAHIAPALGWGGCSG